MGIFSTRSKEKEWEEKLRSAEAKYDALYSENLRLTACLAFANSESQRFQALADRAQRHLDRRKIPHQPLRAKQVPQPETEHIPSIRGSSLFSSFPIFSSIDFSPSDPISSILQCENPRFQASLSDRMTLSNAFLSCSVKTASGSSYHVTLDSCTCPDFTYRRTPCKHMYRLALEVGLCGSVDLSPIAESLTAVHDADERLAAAQRAERQLAARESALAEESQRLSWEKNALAIERSKLQESAYAELFAEKAKFEEQRASFDRLLSDEQQSHPWLASCVADLYLKYDKSLAAQLRNKAHPAQKAADDVSRLAREKHALLIENRELRYQLDFLLSSVPWLEDFISLPVQQADPAFSDDAPPSSEYDILRPYLSLSEYQSLSLAEKYQLALDRWVSHPNKSKFDVGVQYERYIGYLYEKDGYIVSFPGATLRLNDMGRDLIAVKGSTTLVIQCKRWSSFKEIHENAIFQLFGSVAHLRSEHPSQEFIPVFYTTTAVSDVASACAHTLGIELHDNFPFSDYPVIKCNISQATGEKIYHLPFDLQYDRIQISYQDGECYVSTVAEAEALGFRRAYKWHGA